MLHTSHLADGTRGRIKREERLVRAGIAIARSTEIEAAIGIHQPVNRGSIATGEPWNHQALQLAGCGIELIEAAPIDAVVGGEIELAIHIRELARVGRQAAAVDIGGEVGAGGGAIALPELIAVDAIVVAEVQRAPQAEQVADRLLVGRSSREQGPHRAVELHRIQAPEIPLSCVAKNTKKRAQRRAAGCSATTPQAGIIAGIAEQQLAGICCRADLQVAEAVAFVVGGFVQGGAQAEADAGAAGGNRNADAEDLIGIRGPAPQLLHGAGGGDRPADAAAGAGAGARVAVPDERLGEDQLVVDEQLQLLAIP